MNLKEFNNLGLGMSEQEAMECINLNTIEPLTLNDIFIFKVKLCDSSIDRDFDKLSLTFLKEFTKKAQNLIGLYNHNWEQVEKQQIRLFKALCVESEEVPYVLGYAYTLQKNYELIEKIKAGVLKEVSIGFNSAGHTCSICGSAINYGMCEHGHEVGKTYNNSLCYRQIENCIDALEFSLVSVPANSNASIIKNFTGGKKIMKKSMFNFLKFLSTKSYTEEEKSVILKAVEGAEEQTEEISEEEIKELISENASLKEANSSLLAELETIKEELENLKNTPTTEEVQEVEEVIENVEVEEAEETIEKQQVKSVSVSLKPTFAKSSLTKKSAGNTENKGFKGVSVSMNLK